MVNCKWYSVELDEKSAIKLRIFLSDNSIKYEMSEADNLLHFELELSDTQFVIVENYLEKNVR